MLLLLIKQLVQVVCCPFHLSFICFPSFILISATLQFLERKLKTGFGGRHEHVPCILLGAQEVNLGTWPIILKFSYIMKTLAIWSNFRELEHWKESISFYKNGYKDVVLSFF